jgi:ribosomal protein L37AE/L43A
MIKNKQIWTCDLCGNDKTTESTPPAGWITITLENTYSDRTFFDRHICNFCVKEIVKKRGQNDLA